MPGSFTPAVFTTSIALSGVSHSGGAITLTSAPPTSAFADFAFIYPSVAPDPYLTHILNQSIDTATPVNQFARVSLTATAPAGFTPLSGPDQGRAVYAGMGAQEVFMAPAGSAYLDRAQFEQGAYTTLLPAAAEGYDEGLLYVLEPGVTALWERSREHADAGLWSGHYVATTASSPASARHSIVPTLASVTPVVAGTSYVGTVKTGVDLAGRNIYAKFYWYDSTHTYLSTTLGAATVSTGDFEWDTAEVSAQAPTGAAYAGVVPEIVDPLGGFTVEFYVGRHKISASDIAIAGPRTWQPPRQINIALTPDAVNEMQNPAFGDPANPLWGWTTVGPGTSYTANSSDAMHDGRSMDVVSGGWTPSTVAGLLLCGAQTYSSLALYSGVNKPPITTLLPDTDYVVSLWVKPVSAYLPVRISAFDGVTEFVGSATPVLNVYQPRNWQRLSVNMHTDESCTGSARISVGYFRSDLDLYTPPVNPTTPGQTTWTLWTTPPASYKGLWQNAVSYRAGDVVATPFSGAGPNGAYFATALVDNVGVSPDSDYVAQTVWRHFTLTQPDGISPLCIDSYWSSTTRYRGDKLGFGVEYPAGSGTTYIMQKPSLIFGPGNTLPMESHEFRVDEILVQEGQYATDFFDGDVPSTDYLWEGVQYDSRSFYYRNRKSAQERLERVIKSYVPFGTPIQIQYSPSVVTNL